MPGSELLTAACRARDRAIAPFSGFRVGAALEAADGRVFTGCNIENASFGLTLCAERVAVFKALSEGADSFVRLLVVTDTATPTPPCGACRQIIWEFCGDIPIELANPDRVVAGYRSAALLPAPFDRTSLE